MATDRCPLASVRNLPVLVAVFADGRTRRSEATAAGTSHSAIRNSQLLRPPPSSRFAIRNPQFEFLSCLVCVFSFLSPLMLKPPNKLSADQLGQLIYEIRGQRVMLDSDLAAIYGVETKALNRAVKATLTAFRKISYFKSLHANGKT